MDWNIRKPLTPFLEEIIRDIPGHTPVDQLHTLYCMVYLTQPLPGDVLEIGSWCGRSTAVLGEAVRQSGSGRICCIDLFPARNDWRQNPDGTYSFSVTIDGKTYGGYQDQKVWKEAFEQSMSRVYTKSNSVLEIFTDTMAQRQLSHLIDIHRATSAVLETMPDRKFRLAFIDGDHSYDAVCTDIRNVQRRLVDGGWICFDDAFTDYDGVNGAITDLVINSGDFDLCQQMTRKFFVARKASHSR